MASVPIEQAKERIIVALDYSDPAAALKTVQTLSGHVGCFKIGLEMITAMHRREIMLPREEALRAFDAKRELFELLNGNVFWDGKFHDIPNTVDYATAEVVRMSVKMLNVHCSGGEMMMTDARKAVTRAVQETGPGGRRPIILGVTVLTSLAYNDLVKLGIMQELHIADITEEMQAKREYLERFAIRHLARLAEECGLDGVICSPQELRALREYIGPDVIAVTPGVRPAWASADDQKRVMTPGEAIRAGADYLVIGRPITKPPEAVGSPVEAAMRIAEDIAGALAERRG